MPEYINLVECSEHDKQYGIFIVENVTKEEIQNKIYEIKNKFYSEGIDDWTIEDVFAQFPKEWKWEFNRVSGIVEI